MLIEDMPPSESNAILQRINDVLCKYEINHTTVQFEHTKCALSDAPCTILVTHSRARASSLIAIHSSARARNAAVENGSG